MLSHIRSSSIDLYVSLILSRQYDVWSTERGCWGQIQVQSPPLLWPFNTSFRICNITFTFSKSYITFTFWVSSSADNAMFVKQRKSAEVKFRCHIPLLLGLFNTSFQIWYAITLFLSFYFFITFYISSPSDNAMFGQQSKAANSVLPFNGVYKLSDLPSSGPGSTIKYTLIICWPNLDEQMHKKHKKYFS